MLLINKKIEDLTIVEQNRVLSGFYLLKSISKKGAVKAEEWRKGKRAKRLKRKPVKGKDIDINREALATDIEYLFDMNPNLFEGSAKGDTLNKKIKAFQKDGFIFIAK